MTGFATSSFFSRGVAAAVAELLVGFPPGVAEELKTILYPLKARATTNTNDKLRKYDQSSIFS